MFVYIYIYIIFVSGQKRKREKERTHGRDDSKRWLFPLGPIAALSGEGQRVSHKERVCMSQSESRTSASPRIRQSDSPLSIVYPRTAGRRVGRGLYAFGQRDRRRAIRRLFEGRWRSGSRVDRISPVIYSTRVVRRRSAEFRGNPGPYRAHKHEVRDEGETRVKRGWNEG